MIRSRYIAVITMIPLLAVAAIGTPSNAADQLEINILYLEQEIERPPYSPTW